MKVAAVLALVSLSVFAGAQAPGSVDVTYGDGGFARLSVDGNVDVSSFVVSDAGAVAVTFASGPQAGTAGLASADGTDVSQFALPGRGVADFGPAGELVTASASWSSAFEGTVVRRHLADGSLDPSFGSGGEVLLPGRSPGDVAFDGSSVVVVGGRLVAPARVWVSVLDQDGVPAPGLESVVLAMDPTSMSVSTDVHVVDDGYVAVLFLSDSIPERDLVTAYHLDRSGQAESIFDFEAALGDVSAVASHQLIDGSVVVAIQTTDDDVETIHLERVLSDGTLDEGFDSPDLTADEVGGALHLAQLPTGPILVAHNVGPDSSFLVRMVGPDGSALGELPMPSPVDRMWMYGLGVAPDGALLLGVDESPASSAEPDDLSIVRIVGPGRFLDDDGNVHEADIELLAELGVTRGCDPPANVRFCPNEPVTRGEMAALIVRALALPATSEDAFVDDAGSLFEADINRLAAAGVTRGCDPPANIRYCPDQPVSREQMAAFLHRSFPNLSITDPEAGGFTDVWNPVVDVGTPPLFFHDIEWLAQTGVTRGCDPPANTMFCPADRVTRAQMASFLIRALQGAD